VLRSDDSVRRVRAMWLGSGALRWPWDWTYVEWGLAAGCFLLVVPVVGLVIGVLLGPVAGITLGGIGGVLIARELFEHLRLLVDFDRPVRWWRVMIRHELSAGRRATRDVESMRLVASWTEPVGPTRRARLEPRLTSRWRWRRRPARRELARGVPVRLGGNSRGRS
jgi:hypothetical protein